MAKFLDLITYWYFGLSNCG